MLAQLTGILKMLRAAGDKYFSCKILVVINSDKLSLLGRFNFRR